MTLRIVVLGGSGALGSHVVRQALQEGHTVTAVVRIVAAVELLPTDARPVCWFLAGAGLLDLDASGRRGLDLPMVDSSPIGLERLRVSTEHLPAKMPAITTRLPDWMALLPFAWRMPEMIVPYADAAALMLANLKPGQTMARKRVGLTLPEGMRGSKKQWTTRKS